MSNGPQTFENLIDSLDLAKIGISHISFNGDVLWANQSYLDMVGYTTSDIPGLNIEKYTLAEDLPKHLETIRQIRDGELDGFEFDKVWRLRDGQFLWTHIQSKLHRDANGVPQYIVSVSIDIQKRKETETFLNLILGALPSLVSYIDRNSVYRYVNKSYERWFGIPYMDVIGKNMLDIVGDEAFHVIQPHVKRVLNGEYVEYERRVNYRYAGSKDVHVAFIPDLNPIGEVMGFVAIVNDITEYKNHEGFSSDQQNQLIESAKVATFQSLATGLAHEIENPVHELNIALNSILAKIDVTNMQKDIEAVRARSEKLMKIAKKLKSFSDDGQKRYWPECNLAMILEDAVSFHRDACRDRKIDLKIADAKETRLKCLAHDISKAVLNLLTNSFEAVSDLDKRWIEISVDSEHHRIVIGVVDSGPGLSTDVVTQLSTPFFTTKKDRAGSGLGLANSRAIVKNHGGKLYYDSSSANTRFVIELPRRPNYSLVD